MTAPRCTKPASITITANTAACIGCWYAATVPAEPRAPGSRPAGWGLSVQEAAQRLARVALGLLGNARVRHPIEAVIRPRIDVKLDRHPGAVQPIRIDHVFFKEEIETADRDVGRRQARHIPRSRSRRIRRDIGRSRLFVE